MTELLKAVDAERFGSALVSPRVVSLIGIGDEKRNSIRISEKSSYVDDVWDCTVENRDLHPANVTIRLSRIYFDGGVRITDPCKAVYLRLVKEYLFSMLVNPPSARPKWSTVCSTYHRGIARLLRYMDANAFYKFSDLGPTDFEDFLEALAVEPLEGGGVITDRALRARVMGLNWLYEQSSKLEDGLQSNPFGDYGSASGWARACCQKLIPRDGSRTVEMPDEVAREIFSRALDDLSIADTLQRVSEARKCYKPEYYGAKKKLLNPFPWHLFGMVTGHEIVKWEARLATACHIVIAMLTGMRWHEVVALKTGENEVNWREEDIVHDGQRKKFFFVISRTYKLQGEPVEYKWQTLPIVKTAIEAAELGLARRRRGGSFLFPSFHTADARTSDSSSGANFGRFVKAHNITFRGKYWGLASHQFRKKFARIMIRQGLGLKALQDQLKHFDIEMTRVYGDMNLYVELQHEKFQISSEQYEEIMRGQKKFVGGGAVEVSQLQRQFLGMTKNQQEEFLAGLPRSALIEQLDDGLCMYRSKHALCGGDMAACRPADCNNALISIDGKKKSFQWRKNENTRLLNFFRHDQPKVAYLISRNEQLDKLLLQIDQAEIV
ncbi:tyrosine-type recombinase/integrase [Pseudomonas japonica]|uniref:tyrosine-type recombinase/integrase n=1 Tax=Pseudomonas japonica TaxID=256466 RepID=UPI003A8906A1